ncbi:MAG: hypothetical protein ACRDJE_25200 [Dehalococcoidia bacterium]
MHRVSVPLIAVALAIGGGLLAGSTVSAQPALDLKGMALTASDLGAGWRFLADQPVSDGPGYDVAYERTSPSGTANGFLEIILVEDPEETSTPQEVVISFAEDYVGDLSAARVVVDHVPPAMVGRDTAQARIRIDHPNIPPYLSNADLIAWRRGPVLAIVTYFAASDVTVVPFAQRQDAKLVAALAPPSPSPSPSSAPVQVGSLPDLAPVLISPVDLDGTWSVSEQDRRDDRCGAAVQLDLPSPTDWRVEALLFYDPSHNVAAFDLLQVAADELRSVLQEDGRPWDLEVTSAAAPPLSEETARARVTARRDGDILYVDMVTWRRGPIGAIVTTLADEEVDALPYAERQHAKLAAFLDAQPNIAQAAAGCRPLSN